MSQTHRTNTQDPADGTDPQRSAPQARTPGEAGAAAQTTWNAGQGATDFLGLEPELRGLDPAQSGGEDGAAGTATDSWLLDVERSAAGTGLPSAAGNQGDPWAASQAFDAGAEQAPEVPEDPDGEVFVDAVDAAPLAARFSARRLLAAAVLIGVVGTGGWFAWQQWGTPAAEPVEVASRPARTSARPTEVAAVTPVDPPSQASDPAVEPTAAVEPDAPVETGSDPAPVETAGTPDAFTPDVEPAIPTPFEVTVGTAPTTPTTPGDPSARVDVGTVTEPPLSRGDTTTGHGWNQPADAAGPGGGRRATTEDLAGYWFEETIPHEAIGKPGRLRTLRVGRVRAILASGEPVEGTLYAVGEERIWLEVPLGRMSFGAGDVRELVRIVGSPTNPGAPAIAGLPRVEVVLAGGTITGRVLDRAGDSVTLVTEDGLRITTEALDVRPAVNGTTRLVGPLPKR